jgi:hypothetical protein
MIGLNWESGTDEFPVRKHNLCSLVRVNMVHENVLSQVGGFFEFHGKSINGGAFEDYTKVSGLVEVWFCAKWRKLVFIFQLIYWKQILNFI